MKEQDETPEYEAESHSKGFLKEAVAKKKGKKHEMKVKKNEKKVAHKK